MIMERLLRIEVNEDNVYDVVKKLEEIDKTSYKDEYARLNGIIADLEKELENDSDMDINAVNTILSMDFESIYQTLQPNEKRYIWQSIIDYIEVGTNRDDVTIHFR